MTPPIQACFYCGVEYPTPVGLYHTEEECATQAQKNKRKAQTDGR